MSTNPALPKERNAFDNYITVRDALFTYDQVNNQRKDENSYYGWNATTENTLDINIRSRLIELLTKFGEYASTLASFIKTNNDAQNFSTLSPTHQKDLTNLYNSLVESKPDDGNKNANLLSGGKRRFANRRRLFGQTRNHRQILLRRSRSKTYRRRRT